MDGELKKLNQELAFANSLIKDLSEALESVLDEKPLNGEYVHKVSCSGDRRYPPGVKGHSCSCKVGTIASESAIREFVFGKRKMCVVCGAKEPCELKDDKYSPCTFEPTPIELLHANQRLVQRLREKENGI